MLRAIIIDDELNGIKGLETFISESCPHVIVIASSISPEEGITFINNYRPEIVFLDINMPIMSGFEMLQRLAYRDFHLIFTTAHSEYALKAIKHRAVDYLLKPIDTQELVYAVEKVKTKIAERKTGPDLSELFKLLQEGTQVKVAIPDKNGVALVLSSEIAYIEANSNNAIVTFANGRSEAVLKGLKEFEAQLCTHGRGFIRINKSYIINISCVTRYLREDGGYAVLLNKKTIPVSKAVKEEFLKLINFGHGV
jgi:two-component system, LytTR family, response regulator